MINTLLMITLKSSILFIAYIIFKKIMGNKLNANILYRLWFVLFILVCIPFSFESNLSIDNIVDLPIIAETSVIRRTPMVDMNAPNPEMKYNLISISDKEEAISTGNPLLLIYIAGVILSLLITLLIHFKIKNNSKEIKIIEVNEIRKMLNYKKNIRVYETDLLNSPGVIGIFRKRILMPVELVNHLSDEDLKYILMHEIMHLKQFDNVINYLLLLYKSIFWFNPLTHIFFKLIKEDMEYACDHKLIVYLSHEEKKSYGHLLINVASQLSSRKYYLVLPLIKNKKGLTMRINKIMYMKKHSRILLIVLLLALTMVSGIVLAKPISKVVKEGHENLTLKKTLLDFELANELEGDYIYALEILKNYRPILITDYRDFNNNSELVEYQYEILDEPSKILSVVKKLNDIKSIEILDSSIVSSMTRINSTYVIQTPLVNAVKDLMILTDDVIGKELSEEVLDVISTKFIYNSSDNKQMVYLIQDGESALSILTEDSIIIDYRYFLLEEYDINLETLFWMTFYNKETFDYNEFKKEVLVNLMDYIVEDVDLRKNIFPVEMNGFYHVFLDQNYALRMAKDTNDIFYIKYPENIHYDAKIGLSEIESKVIAENFIEKTSLKDLSLELINVSYENIYGSQTVEYYVFQYALDKKGVYIKVNTMAEVIAEITLYEME